MSQASPNNNETSHADWLKFKEGNKEAFSRIFAQHSEQLFRYGMSLKNDRELIKDHIQNLFVYLWKNRQNLGLVRNVRYYLIKSLRRRILLQLRKDRHTQHTNLKELNQEELSYSPDYFDEESERVQLIKREILNLPERQQMIVHLRFYQELSYEEIGEIMQLDYQVLRNLVYRAIKSLKKSTCSHFLPDEDHGQNPPK